MSFEGYYQLICKNGHYWTVECGYSFDDEELESKCAVCGEGAVWYNLVDVTNGSFDLDGKRIDGFVNPKLKKRDKCKHCGSILESTYEIPKKGHRLTKKRKTYNAKEAKKHIEEL